MNKPTALMKCSFAVGRMLDARDALIAIRDDVVCQANLSDDFMTRIRETADTLEEAYKRIQVRAANV